MDKGEANKRLTEALDSFDNETKVFDPYSHRQVTEGELSELARQVSYVLSAFKSAIVDSMD